MLWVKASLASCEFLSRNNTGNVCTTDINNVMSYLLLHHSHKTTCKTIGTTLHWNKFVSIPDSYIMSKN